MQDKFFIKPAPGLIIRDPVTKVPLAEVGEVKPRSAYWLRRFRDGSVIAASAPKPAKAAKEDSKQ